MHQAALAEPELAFAIHQAVAEHRAEQFEDVAFAEVAIFGDEHLLDEIGMRGQVDVAMAEAEGDQIAVFAIAAGEEAEHIAAEIGEVAQEPVAGGRGGAQGLRRGHGVALGRVDLRGKSSLGGSAEETMNVER